VESLQVLDLNEEQSVGFLTGRDHTVSVNRWVGSSKGKFRFRVRARSSSSRVRD